MTAEKTINIRRGTSVIETCSNKTDNNSDKTNFYIQTKENGNVTKLPIEELDDSTYYVFENTENICR